MNYQQNISSKNCVVVHISSKLNIFGFHWIILESVKTRKVSCHQLTEIEIFKKMSKKWWKNFNPFKYFSTCKVSFIKASFIYLITRSLIQSLTHLHSSLSHSSLIPAFMMRQWSACERILLVNLPPLQVLRTEHLDLVRWMGGRMGGWTSESERVKEGKMSKWMGGSGERWH